MPCSSIRNVKALTSKQVNAHGQATASYFGQWTGLPLRQSSIDKKNVPEAMYQKICYTNLYGGVTPRANGPQLARAFRVQYYAALRSCEVEKIRGGDLRVEGSWSHLLIRHDKTKSYSTDKQRCKPLTHVATEEVRNALRDVTHGDLAFPAYKKRSTSKLVKRASTELGWPSGVTFDGTHTLRHGGTGAIVENVADMMSSALSGMSRQVRPKHYLAPRSQVHD